MKKKLYLQYNNKILRINFPRKLQDLSEEDHNTIEIYRIRYGCWNDIPGSWLGRPLH